MSSSSEAMTLQPIPQHPPRLSFEPFNVKADNEPFSSRYSLDEATPDPTFRQRFARFPWRSFCIIASLPLALAPIVLLASLAEIASTGYIQNRDCYPNGLWSEATGATWRIMDSSYFFTPNLSFGSMTFTAAKVIDISWDLLIGRGGQMLLAWVNYRVFNEWILYHMEMHLTSYKMYTAVAFQTTSLSTLGVLAKEWLAFGENNWRRFFRWLTLLCMMLSTLYVLSFPTLMGALTGYITTYEAYIEDTSSNLIKFSEFSPVKWIVWDAERVVGNYTKPLVVSQDDSSLSKDLENCEFTYSPTNLPQLHLDATDGAQMSIPSSTGTATKQSQSLQCGESIFLNILRLHLVLPISSASPSTGLLRLQSMAPNTN